MKKIAFSLLLATALCFVAKGQYTKEELKNIINNSSKGQLVRENTQLLLVKIYNQSIKIADKLLELEPNNANFNYRKGYALLYSNSNFSLALPYLIKANKSISKKYDGSNGDETNAPIDASYHLAHCYHLSGEIDSAVAYFNKYIEVAPKTNELVAYSRVGIKQCAVAKKAFANPKEYKLQNIGDSINTNYPEYSSVVSLDGNSLYFTSRRLWNDSSNFSMIDPASGLYFEDIYVSYKDNDGKWTKAEKLELCKRKRMEATVSVSSDEKTIYTYEDKTGNGDIYFTQFKNGYFYDLQPVEIPNVNTNAWETHMVVSADGQRLFFVSDREGGYGGRDIYIMRKLPNGEWSLPENMGPKINSPFDEDAPFISVDNKTLYYASNGLTSMGGFDIFISVLMEDNKWSDPINLGYPLNSTADDVFYTTTVDGMIGYLTSVREGGKGDKDIYQIQNDQFQPENIAVLKGKINTITGEPIPDNISVTLTCLNCGNMDSKDILPKKRYGRFFSMIDGCRKYAVIYKKDGKEFYREKIETNCKPAYQEVKVAILLRPSDLKVIPFKQYYLVGNVTDSDDSTTIEGAQIEFVAPVTEKIVETLQTKAEGNFVSSLAKGKSYEDSLIYQVRISKKGYITQTFDVREVFADKQTIALNFKLQKMDLGTDVGKILALEPINFDLDKSDIRPDAEIELNKIVKIMNENPTMKIELSSHTDCRGSARYNMALSNRRAKSSAEYIRSKITDPERIYGKGYGETKLLNDCDCRSNTCSEEEHAVNRRTEFRIVK